MFVFTQEMGNCSVLKKCDPKLVVRIYFKIKIISYTGLFSVCLLPFFILKRNKFTNQWQIQHFPEGDQLPKWDYFAIFWPKTCMKIKEFGPLGVHVPDTPFNLPMQMIMQIINKEPNSSKTIDTHS